MSGDDNVRICFGDSWPPVEGGGGDRYIGTGNIYSYPPYWYTIGSKLYIAKNCDWDENEGNYRNCETVELTYSVTGSGSGKTLTINGDRWVLEREYYWLYSKISGKVLIFSGWMY